MIKLWIELRRQPDVDRAELLEVIQGSYRAILAECGEELGLLRAVLDARIDAPEIDAFSTERGWSEAADAMFETWFPDRDALSSALGIQDAARMHERFAWVTQPVADCGRMSAVVTRDHEVFDLFPPETDRNTHERVKLLVQNHALPTLTHDQFTDHWMNTHASLVRDVGVALGYRRYVQDHPIASDAVASYAAGKGWQQPPNGGITEVWWDSRESQVAAFDSEEGRRASAVMAEDEPRFVHPPAMTAMLCVEEVLFMPALQRQTP